MAHQKAIRTSSINIETQVIHGPKWISANLQQLEIDDVGNVVSTSVRERKLYRRVGDVATETVTVTDPVTQQQVTVSVAGIGGLVKAAMIKWMIEDNNATYDPTIDLVVLNDTVV